MSLVTHNQETVFKAALPQGGRNYLILIYNMAM